MKKPTFFFFALIALPFGLAVTSGLGGCDDISGYDPPDSGLPKLISADDGGGELSDCSAPQNGPVILTANGAATARLRLQTYTNTKLIDPYSVTVVTPDGLVTISPPGQTLDASVTIPVNLPNQATEITLHAGAISGNGRVQLIVAGKYIDYCVSLIDGASPKDKSKTVGAIELALTPVGDAGAPSAYNLSATVRDPNSDLVDDNVEITWQASNCGLLAITTPTKTRNGIATNTLYLRPELGPTQIDVLPLDGDASIARHACIGPTGASAIPVEGGCPGADSGVVCY